MKHHQKMNTARSHTFRLPRCLRAGVIQFSVPVVLGIGLFLTNAVSATGSDDENEAWIDLFNGRDLAGWVNVNSAPETWTVREGILHCTGRPISALRTIRQYENFILELEWRHLTEGGNSGIFLWASPLAAPGVPFLRGIEAQVLDHGYGRSDWFTTHGDVFPIHGATMTPFPPSRGSRSFPSEERSKGAPEWNHYRIECKDGVIRLHVNGKEVSGGKDCNYRKGYIALEAEGAPVDFRNIRIIELPSTGASADETAPLAQGHRTLYTGTDLRGWRGGGEDLVANVFGPWEVDDWRLLLKEGGSGQNLLWTADRFADAEFIVDCHFGARPEGEDPVRPVVYVLGGDGNEGVPVTLAGDLGVWQRFTIRVQGERLTVLRGEPGVEIDAFDLPGDRVVRGRFGLLDVPGAIQFANLYVRDLDE